MDLSSIEQIIRTQVPNAQDSEVKLYLDSVKRDMGFGADYSDMSEDDIVEDFEFYFQSKMDEAQKPSMKMKKSELKEMIKAAFLSEAKPYKPKYNPMASLGGGKGYHIDEDKFDDKITNLKKYTYTLNGKKVTPEIGYFDHLLKAMISTPRSGDEYFDYEFYRIGEPDESGNIELSPEKGKKGMYTEEMIKAAFLSEADFTNAQDDDAALGGMYDPVYEGEDEEESLEAILSRITGTSVDPYMAEAEEKEETAEQILARITGTKIDPYLAEAEEEETDIDVDAEEETDGGEETSNDSIVVDKKIVSLSSLPQNTRKILDSLETLRAQAEEFGDQKFITQVGNTITFFTRDFVVAGDEPTKAKVDESLEILKMKKLAGLLKEGEYSKALLKEIGMEASFLPVDPVPGTAQVYSDLVDKFKDKIENSPLFEKIVDMIISKMSEKEKQAFINKFKGKDEESIFKMGMSSLKNLNEEIYRQSAAGKFIALLGNLAGINLMALGGVPLGAFIGKVLLNIPLPVIPALISLVVSIIINRIAAKLLGSNPNYGGIADLEEAEESIADFLNANIEEFKKKVADPRSKFEIIGDKKVATAGPDDESGIDVSFDKEHMLELFPAGDPFNKVEETEIAGRKIYYNNYL